MFPFSGPFSWGTQKRGRLLYGREPNGVRAEPGKQKTGSGRTQELALSSTQENQWQKKAGYRTQ
jgi:hypothetical protein